MARKVRRVRRPKPSISSAHSSDQDLTEEEELQLEYAYVLQDLQRVFILAAIMFALLIALNLLL